MIDMLSYINLPSFASRRSTSTKLLKISPKTQIWMRHLGDGLAPTCLAKPSDPNCFHSLFNFSLFACFPPGRLHQENAFFHSNGYRNIHKII